MLSAGGNIQGSIQSGCSGMVAPHFWIEPHHRSLQGYFLVLKGSKKSPFRPFPPSPLPAAVAFPVMAGVGEGSTRVVPVCLSQAACRLGSAEDRESGAPPPSYQTGHPLPYTCSQGMGQGEGNYSPSLLLPLSLSSNESSPSVAQLGQAGTALVLPQLPEQQEKQ